MQGGWLGDGSDGHTVEQEADWSDRFARLREPAAFADLAIAITEA
jgi:hypothetical protein